MNNTWKYLKQRDKDAITYLTVENFESLLKHKQFGEFYNTHRLIVQLYHEGKVLSNDLKDCLILPFKLWGANAEHHMERNRREGNQPISKRGRVDRHTRTLVQDLKVEDAAELIKNGEWFELKEAALIMQAMDSMDMLNDDQKEFLELASAYKHKYPQ
jgi:hypothetical protein